MEQQGKPGSPLVLIGPQDRFPRVELTEPSARGFLLLTAEVDLRPAPLSWWQSRKRTRLAAAAKAVAITLEADSAVIEAKVFTAMLIPPGEGAFLRERPSVHRARFDLVVLVETASVEAAQTLRSAPVLSGLVETIGAEARHTAVITASNVRRIAPVDHQRQGVFLFNFFHADRQEQNLAVWEYTAGWFQDQTALDNSTVLLPEPGSPTDYTIINHCRWDRLADVLPSLIFKRSFHDYVLAHFAANHTAAMPILYRLA